MQINITCYTKPTPNNNIIQLPTYNIVIIKLISLLTDLRFNTSRSAISSTSPTGQALIACCLMASFHYFARCIITCCEMASVFKTQLICPLAEVTSRLPRFIVLLLFKSLKLGLNLFMSKNILFFYYYSYFYYCTGSTFLLIHMKYVLFLQKRIYNMRQVV